MKIVCAFEDSPQAIKALNHAAKICSEMKSYELLILNVIALTKIPSLPILDRLEGSMNIEREELAEKEELRLEKLVRNMQPLVEYNYVQIEGSGTPGFIFSEYLSEFKPDMVVVGASRKMKLESFVLGSFTDYCVQNLPYPVTVVKVT